MAAATRVDPIDELLAIEDGDVEALASWNDDNGYSLSRINETNYTDHNVDLSDVSDPFPRTAPGERAWPLLRTERASNITYAVKSAVSSGLLRCVEVLTGNGAYSGRSVLVEAARLAPGFAVAPTSEEALLEDVLKSGAYRSRVSKLEAGGLLVVGAQTAAELRELLDEPSGAPSAYTVLGHVARTYSSRKDILSLDATTCYAAVYSIMRNGQLQMVSGDELARAASGSILNDSWHVRRLDLVTLPFEAFAVIEAPRSRVGSTIEILAATAAGKASGFKNNAAAGLVAEYARRAAEELRFARITQQYSCEARSAGDASLLEGVRGAFDHSSWVVVETGIDEGADLVRYSERNTALAFYSSELVVRGASDDDNTLQPQLLSVLECTNETRTLITVIDPARDADGKLLAADEGRTLETNQMEMARHLLRLYRYARPLGDLPTLRGVRAGIAEFATPLDGETASGTLQSTDDQNTYLQKQLSSAAADIDALLGPYTATRLPPQPAETTEDGDTTEEALSGAEEEIDELQTQVEQLLRQNAEQASVIAELRDRIASLERALDACTTGRGGTEAGLRQLLDERTDQNASLEAEIERLRAQIRALNRQLREGITAAGSGGVDAEEVAALEAENEALDVENERLQAENARLRGENAQLRDELAAQRRAGGGGGAVVEVVRPRRRGEELGEFAVEVPASRSELPFDLATLDAAGRLPRAAGAAASLLVDFGGGGLRVRAAAVTPFQADALQMMRGGRAFAVRRAGASDARPAPSGLVPPDAAAAPRDNAAFVVPAAGSVSVTLGGGATVRGTYDARAAARRVGVSEAVDLVLGNNELRIRLLGGAPAGQLYWIHAIVFTN